MSPYTDLILDLALECLSYDPNFTDAMDEDHDEDMDGYEDEDEYENLCVTQTYSIYEQAKCTLL